MQRLPVVTYVPIGTERSERALRGRASIRFDGTVATLTVDNVVGGAAVSEEFHPGYRNSVASYVVSLLRPEVVRDLELARHGYEPIPLCHSLCLDSRGDCLLLDGSETSDRVQFEKFSPTDYDDYLAFEASVEQAGGLLATQWLKAPPRLPGGGLRDLLDAMKPGLDVRRLEPDQLYSMRPHPQAAQYATPVPGLYLCGSGTHPGVGVTGAPGHNASARILADRRHRARS